MMFDPDPARAALRLGSLLEPDERVVRSARASIPARSELPREWVVLTDRRLLLVAVDLGGHPAPVPGLAPPPPDPAALRPIPLGDVVGVRTTPGTHRVLDGDILWSAFATLRVAMRDGTVERVGLRQPDADALFDEIRRLRGLRDGAAAGGAGDPAIGEPAPGGDAWVPLVAVAGVILPIVLIALLGAR